MARRKKNLFGNKAESGQRMQRVLLWCAVAAVCLLVAGVAAWYQTLAYLQGDSFRRTLAEHLRNSAHAAELALHSNLRLDGDRVEEDGLTLSGAGALRSARAGHISMDVDRAALAGRVVHIRKVSVDDGELVFESDASAKATPTAKKQGKPHKTKPAPAKTTETSAAGKPEKASKSSFFTPKRQELELLECKAADLIFRRSGQSISLLNCALTSTPMKKGGWQHQLENGRVHTPFDFLRGASLKSATVTQEGERLDLTDCRLMLSPGEMRVRAHAERGTGKWSANVALNKASVSPLLRGDWQKRLTGELFGKLTLTGSANALEAGEGYLSLQQGVLEGLPFLSALPAGGGYPYRRLELEKAECRISYPYEAPERNLHDAWLFDGINIRSAGGWLRVQGHVIIAADHTLGGTLTIGIPAAVAQALPAAGALQSIFNAQGEAGYAWLNLNLSGTLEDPEEDLSVRCAALMQSLLPQAAAKTADTAEQMFRALLSPAAPAPQEDGETAPAPSPAAPLKAAAEGVQQGINGALKLLF
ncbi:MAG: hypothetical protein MJ051_00970 [Akkermansia sp.]|nr:hypothetical protein [Akkermansia sp.]